MIICQKQDVIIFISLRQANGWKFCLDIAQFWFGSCSATMIEYVAIEMEMDVAGMGIAADMGMH